MSAPNSRYTTGSLLKDLTLNALVNGRVVDGIVEEGQAEYITTKIIEQSNAMYQDRGTGNKMLENFEDRVAFLGDPTIKGQVQSVAAVTGGIRINFTDTAYDAFRKNDDVDTKFAGNQAKVLEANAGYIIVAQRDGYTAPIAGDYAVGSTVIQRKRSIDLRGTSAPVSVNQVPDFWKNHVSVVDDGGQQSLFDSLNSTNMRNAGDYIVNVPIQNAVGRFFRNLSATYWTSKNVNPETNGMTYSATSGIIEQIQAGGAYYPMTSLVTKTEFENRVRTWLLSNPHDMNDNRVIKTGSMGMGLISSWYQDLIKYDAEVAMDFTDGSVNGLNATKIWIPALGRINVVYDKLQDMNLNGALTSVTAYQGLPKTSGDFYFMDFSPVRMQENGMMAPALQKIHLREKYFFGFEQGLAPTSSLDSAMSGTALTLDNMELTSTTKDYNSFRMWSACGINVLNRSAHAYLENFV